MGNKFNLKSDFTDQGDQPEAIKKLTDNINNQKKNQVLLGVTGSGKTYTMARVIEETQMPVLIISHNKTLTAQLYSEIKSFFPDNAVEYFVSYYDYYQPEAYVPQTDTYIEKDASINDRIDRLRLKATTSLLSRKDVVIVASVSCIYGIGSPKEWKKMLVSLEIGKNYSRNSLLSDLVSLQYKRNDIEFTNGNFRVRGPVIDIFPAYYEEKAVRLELKNEKIKKISTINPVTGKKLEEFKNYVIYPATHFVAPRETIDRAVESIRKELKERVKELKNKQKHLEAQRLQMRCKYDIEMLKETGYCKGIENYSRHLSGRKPKEPPACLINYFPDKFLTILDESHVTVPQIKAMYKGDRARKKTLIKHGFRLPSAIDNRPLNFREFNDTINYSLYVSATPGDYEKEKATGSGGIVEQIIRPTGLVDPEVDIRPVENQVRDLIREVTERAADNERVLATTLTKRMAEDLAGYLDKENLRVRYLHSEIDTIERINILKELRKGNFDCLVGVNLLREGLDLPEVTLVAVLDADKEGFLRSETSLIQVCGRAARNVKGEVILYADKITGSIKRAVDEMDRRRKIQKEYNKKNNITPRTIVKAIRDEHEFRYKSKKEASQYIKKAGWDINSSEAEKKPEKLIKEMEKDMKEAADMLDFELAAVIRDKINEIKKEQL
ncbi:MAG: excinuclease ABC subunit UvrB [Elusimicrobiota bacterium]